MVPMLIMFLYIAAALLLGFFIGKLTNWMKLTSIIGYILAGIILGPVLNVVSLSDATSSMIVDFSLSIIAFLIGLGFTRQFFRSVGGSVVKITLGETILAFIFVFVSLYLLTRDLVLSLVFASVAPASAPAGTVAALHETKARGRFAQLVLGVVGFDDAFAIVIFVLSLGLVTILIGDTFSLVSMTRLIMVEIGAAVIIGAVLGYLMGALLNKLKDREDILVMAIAFPILCTGIMLWIDGSFILSCIIMGTVFIHTSPQIGHSTSDMMEKLLPPIFILFFVVAGLSLEPKLLLTSGLIGITYIGSRSLGLITGARLGCMWAGTSRKIRENLGYAILSQAGVAIGLALLVMNKISDHPDGEDIGAIAVTVIMGTTVFFEIIGPLGVKYAVGKVNTPVDDNRRTIRKMARNCNNVQVMDSSVERESWVYSGGDERECIYTTGDDGKSRH